jgi:antitoxin Phd
MRNRRRGPWQLQDAKARFSEVFDLAAKGEPQTVTRRGKDAVVVLSREQYETLRGPRESFISFLLHSSPKIEGGIPIPENDAAYEPRAD